jgi:hypothetical protein
VTDSCNRMTGGNFAHPNERNVPMWGWLLLCRQGLKRRRNIWEKGTLGDFSCVAMGGERLLPFLLQSH